MVSTFTAAVAATTRYPIAPQLPLFVPPTQWRPAPAAPASAYSLARSALRQRRSRQPCVRLWWQARVRRGAATPPRGTDAHTVWPGPRYGGRRARLLCSQRAPRRQLRRSGSVPRRLATLSASASSSSPQSPYPPSTARTPACSATSRVDSDSQGRKLRVFSGVQPTGTLHLGNFLGAIRQWVTHQYAYDSIFCVVDLHAITVPHDPRRLADETLNTAAMYIACGIDPEQSTVFVQSHVRAHTELTWLLNCMTPMGWLDKMAQFKDKRSKLQQTAAAAAVAAGNDQSEIATGGTVGAAATSWPPSASTSAPVSSSGSSSAPSVYVGLYDYPVLMASDILLYQADCVPVGDDQQQHLELARDIARAFNHTYCRRRKPRKLPSVFREPRPLIHRVGGGSGDGSNGASGDHDAHARNDDDPRGRTAAADGGAPLSSPWSSHGADADAGVARVMSLTDGTAKMSKSADSDASRINLLDDAATIRAKIKRCKTDSHRGLEWHNAARPECANLLNIYRAVSGQSEETVAREVAHMSWGAFKPLLADALIEHLTPVQRRYAEVVQERGELQRVLRAGRERAAGTADETVRRAKDAMGFALLDDDGGGNEHRSQ